MDKILPELIQYAPFAAGLGSLEQRHREQPGAPNEAFLNGGVLGLLKYYYENPMNQHEEEKKEEELPQRQEQPRQHEQQRRQHLSEEQFRDVTHEVPFQRSREFQRLNPLERAFFDNIYDIPSNISNQERRSREQEIIARQFPEIIDQLRIEDQANLQDIEPNEVRQDELQQVEDQEENSENEADEDNPLLGVHINPIARVNDFINNHDIERLKKAKSPFLAMLSYGLLSRIDMVGQPNSDLLLQTTPYNEDELDKIKQKEQEMMDKPLINDTQCRRIFYIDPKDGKAKSYQICSGGYGIHNEDDSTQEG